MSSLISRFKSGSGGAVFAAGRGVSVFWQIALTAIVTRVLTPADLGRFTVAFVTANLVGMFCGLSIRRLVMRRAVGALVSDLKITVALASALGLVISYVACALMFDARAGLLALEITLWRAADSYAEIGQGILCLKGELSRAGRWVAVRTTAPAIVAIGLLPFVDVTIAFAVSALVRIAVVLIETHLSEPQPLQAVGFATMGAIARSGLYLSLLNVVILMVDTAPTLGIGKFAGLADASLLAPLGRVRFGLTIVASTLGEIYYAEMVRRNARERDVLGVVGRPIRLFVPFAAVLGVITVGGGARLLFGPMLVGHNGLVLLAVVAGTLTGVSTIASSGLTAQNRIGVQFVGFTAAVLIATVGCWLFDWQVRALYLAQIIGSVLAMIVFLVGGYRTSLRDLVRVVVRRGEPRAVTAQSLPATPLENATSSLSG